MIPNFLAAVRLFFVYIQLKRKLFCVDLPLDVLHKLEVGSPLLDLLDWSRGQFVDELAENNAILQVVFIGGVGERLSKDGADPVQHLLFLFLVPRLEDRTTIITSNASDFNWGRKKITEMNAINMQQNCSVITNEAHKLCKKIETCKFRTLAVKHSLQCQVVWWRTSGFQHHLRK